MTKSPARPTVMIWHPGASISTADVAAGLGYGLEQHGINVLWYRTDAHIEAAGAYLKTAHALRTAVGGDAPPEVSQGDILHWANKDILYRALRARREQGLEWILCVSGMYQHPDFVVLLRDCGFKIAFLATESPYDAPQELRMAGWVDAVFTCERSMMPRFARVNPQTSYLPHAWHPGVHAIASAGDAAGACAAHDVVFVGTYFEERVAFLAAIDWTGIDLGLYGNTEDIDRTTPAGAVLAPHIRGGYLLNTATAALYRAARIGLNLHRTSRGYMRGDHISAGEAESLNPRCYELAAVGCYAVTDRRAEAAEVFGDALDTFTSPETCEALIRRALADAPYRARQAAAAHAAVQPHTWTDRAARVLAALARVERTDMEEPAA